MTDATTLPYAMRTRIVLKEKNLPFERILMDLPNQEQKEPWYLTLNPYGKVPLLVEKGAWVYESALCNEYGRTIPNPTVGTDRSWHQGADALMGRIL